MKIPASVGFGIGRDRFGFAPSKRWRRKENVVSLAFVSEVTAGGEGFDETDVLLFTDISHLEGKTGPPEVLTIQLPHWNCCTGPIDARFHARLSNDALMAAVGDRVWLRNDMSGNVRSQLDRAGTAGPKPLLKRLATKVWGY